MLRAYGRVGGWILRDFLFACLFGLLAMKNVNGLREQMDFFLN